MFCSHCGGAVEDGAKFCPNCGEKIVPPVGSDMTVPTPKIETPFETKKDDAADHSAEEMAGAAGAAAAGAAFGSTGSPFKTESTYESHTYNADAFSSKSSAGDSFGSTATGGTNAGSSYSGYQQSGQSDRYKGIAPITKRSIPLCIVFTIITCGIYGIYWLIVMVNDLNTVTEEPNETSGGMVFLFTLITCGIYGLYWMYKAGTRLDNLKESLGRERDSRGIVYLILCVFGLNIVAYCLIQNELNKLSDGTY